MDLMSEDRLEMSQRERDVLKVMSAVLSGRRTKKEAARLLKRSVRQVRRLARRLEAAGDGAVIHGLRGKPSNRRLATHVQEQALDIYRRELSDFGPTLASEKLAERGLLVSADTLRRWLLAAGLWQRRRQRDEHRSRRRRRECCGELVQMDTSIHEWLEGRGEAMVLTAMIDDATNLIEARFYAGETVVGHFDLLGRWLARHGRPLALYTDRDTIFASPVKEPLGEPAATQFGRALGELQIDLILARSPQAKGRVERFFQLAQDRWVKELRLADARKMADANRLVEQRLIPEYNRRFRRRPASPNDAHRSLGPRHNPSAVLSVQERRVVSNDYTVRYHNRCFQLRKPALPGLRQGRVVLEERLDGTLAIRFGTRYLDYREIDVSGGALGALPPDPRSLTLSRLPAGAVEAGGASAEAPPPAVQPTNGRSGRTPAVPYPPASEAETTTTPYRPKATHPWRRTFLKR
jgi:transposase-like protein